MAGDFAYVSSFHSEPPSTATTEFDLTVRYGEKGARLNIRLATPLAAHLPFQPALAAEFRELAAALLRIADQPSAILGHNPERS